MTHTRRLPLLGHTHPDQIVAWHKGNAITVACFLSDVHALAHQLPPGRHLLNICRDRYLFTVGLAAALLTGKVSLLPSTHTPATIQQMRAFAPDVFCLHDVLDCSIDLPQFRYPEVLTSAKSDHSVPLIDSEQLVVVVFTSGSTGSPVPHQKHWGPLVQSIHGEAERLGLTTMACAHSIVGTVPPQHMYGFESTVLLALLNGHALSSAQPFFPADIVMALEEVPMPRILVSTPVHMRLLIDTELNAPEVALVLSATAPLSSPLARAVEAHFDTQLQEIYGSTETGMIATRRPTQTSEWLLFNGLTLSQNGEIITASGAHVTQPLVLNDVIELTQKNCFLLHGRTEELINIAGKRSSLAHLNHVLNTVDGVLDGAFYMPDDTDPDRVMRLAACVVAPASSAQHILTALRAHIDPVFLPRPLLLVAALPRNSTGKLTRDALHKLIQDTLGQRP